MSGIEIACLVLDAIPLFVAFGKAAATNADAARRAVRSTHHNEQLRDFHRQTGCMRCNSSATHLVMRLLHKAKGAKASILLAD
jgi:hypothetical protein